MSTIYTVEGNTSNSVAKRSYPSTYATIAKIWRPKYNIGEAAKVAQEALKYVGYLAKKSNSQLENFTANVGGKYNMFAPHAAQATGATNIYVNGVAWCDIFEDDMFIRALGVTRAKQLLYGWSAYTPTSSAYLQKAGATEIKDFSESTYGDVIFFKNSSSICHVGIVVTNVPGSSTSSSTSTPISSISKLKITSNIKSVQTWLNTYYKTGLVIDGIYGSKTKAALIKAWQTEIGGLTVDGIFGIKSKTASRTHIIKNGSSGILVTIWQAYLVCRGYNPNGIDSNFGSGCRTATIAFQKANGLTQDGIVGVNTWTKAFA